MKIKDITGKVIFEDESDTLGECVSNAIKHGVDLSEANLFRTNLSGANLSKAYLFGAVLSEANLSRAVLSRANFSGAYLFGADLFGANLFGAVLSRTNFSKANFSKANLSEADLSEADLSEANLPHFQICPEEGSFIAWKALHGGYVAKLLILEESKRTSSLKGRKCRADKVKVLQIIHKRNGSTVTVGRGFYDRNLTYEVGKTIKADSYNDDIRIECTNGIHFFMTREEASELADHCLF